MAGSVYTLVHLERAVGQVLKRLRKHARITQEQAAADAGMDRSHLSGLEAGDHEPGLFTLAKLAPIYGLSLAALCEIIDQGAIRKANRKRPAPRP